MVSYILGTKNANGAAIYYCKTLLWGNMSYTIFFTQFRCCIPIVNTKLQFMLYNRHISAAAVATTNDEPFYYNHRLLHNNKQCNT